MILRFEWRKEKNFLKEKKDRKIFFQGVLVCWIFSILFCGMVGGLDWGVRAAMQSGSYDIKADSINFYGDIHSSGSYEINDTAGEVATGDSSSTSYEDRAGYQAMISEYRIALDCSAAVNMGTITGTGQSALGSNEATCLVITDNPTGYSLLFESTSDYLENANADKINPYTPVVFGTPEYWDVDPAASEWGARLKSTSTTYDSGQWGSASLSEDYNNADVYWHPVSNSGGFSVADRSSQTDPSGDTEILQFGAEVGSSVLQPTGTYDTDVTITVISY